jgi:vacuolar-type H+-ATPase subunit I/STV1
LTNLTVKLKGVTMDEKNNSVEQTQATENNVEKVTEVSNETKSAESKAFTEDQVEAIVQRRLERYKKTVSSKLDGLDLEEAKKLLEEKKQKEQELALQRGEFDKVLKETVSKKDSKISALESELQKIRIDETLINTASQLKAINPNEVKALLRSAVKLNDSGNVEVVSENGTPRYNEKGELMSVNELVAEYLNNNPHHLSATPKGTGSQSGIGGNTLKPFNIANLDLSKAEDRKIYAEHKKQREQGGLKANLIINN